MSAVPGMKCPSCGELDDMVFIGGTIDVGIRLYACKICGAVATETNKIRNK